MVATTKGKVSNEIPIYLTRRKGYESENESLVVLPTHEIAGNNETSANTTNREETNKTDNLISAKIQSISASGNVFIKFN